MLRVCVPIGYGADLRIIVRVNGLRSKLGQHVAYSFSPPEVVGSEPLPYDGNGDELILRGKNFGNVPSSAAVTVDGRPCLNALWHPSHIADGLPYVTCKAPKGIVGANNISLFVAEQNSEGLRRSRESALVISPVRSVCKEGEKQLNGSLPLLLGKGRRTMRILSRRSTLQPINVQAAHRIEHILASLS